VLGAEQDLPWHLPEDFKRFKELTSGHKIIMGRRTLETFPRALPNREHIVISRNPDYIPPFPVTLTGSLEEAIERVEASELAFIIGGGNIYRQSMDIATHIELTRIHTELQGDTFFPEIDTARWQLLWTKYHPADERHAFSFTFQHFIRNDLQGSPDSSVPWLVSR